jgi:hypothetical protein
LLSKFLNKYKKKSLFNKLQLQAESTQTNQATLSLDGFVADSSLLKRVFLDSSKVPHSKDIDLEEYPSCIINSSYPFNEQTVKVLLLDSLSPNTSEHLKIGRRIIAIQEKNENIHGMIFFEINDFDQSVGYDGMPIKNLNAIGMTIFWNFELEFKGKLAATITVARKNKLYGHELISSAINVVGNLTDIHRIHIAGPSNEYARNFPVDTCCIANFLSSTAAQSGCILEFKNIAFEEAECTELAKSSAHLAFYNCTFEDGGNCFAQSGMITKGIGLILRFKLCLPGMCQLIQAIELGYVKHLYLDKLELVKEDLFGIVKSAGQRGFSIDLSGTFDTKLDEILDMDNDDEICNEKLMKLLDKRLVLGEDLKVKGQSNFLELFEECIRIAQKMQKKDLAQI